MLFGELENFKSLNKFLDGKNHEFLYNEKNKAIKAIYKNFWSINNDD
jgi:hypothetical protein